MTTIKLKRPRAPEVPAEERSDRVQLVRRVESLSRRARDAEGRERYWREVALVSQATSDPAERFAAGMRALLLDDPALDPSTLPILKPDACRYLLEERAGNGPYLVQLLLANPQLAARIADLPGAEQVVALSRLSVGVEAQNRRPSEQPRSAADVLEIAQGGLT